LVVGSVLCLGICRPMALTAFVFIRAARPLLNGGHLRQYVKKYSLRFHPN
jgi:hypothetical protein